jgi:RNA polymerase sigma-70 factor (ECF subfamily)
VGAPSAEGESLRRRVADLYRELGPAVYRRCNRLLKDPDGAADATQEVFLRLVRHLDRVAGRTDLQPWLFRVATNHCLNLLRGQRTRGEEPLGPVDEPSTSPNGAVLADRLLRRLVDRFDAATQAVVLGVLVEGLDAEEMAQRLGVSRRTVARKLDRFLALARHYLTMGLPPVESK